MVWLEVETKVKLENKQVPALRKKIKQIAKFEKRGQKSDDYFAIQRLGFPKKAFRFRSMKDHIEVTFKGNGKNKTVAKCLFTQDLGNIRFSQVIP